MSAASITALTRAVEAGTDSACSTTAPRFCRQCAPAGDGAGEAIPANECYGRYSDVLGKDPEVRILGEREFGKLMTVTFGEPSYGKKLGGKVVKVRRLAQL